MRDFLTAIWGGRHCGWCTDKPDTFFDRLFRLNQLVARKDRPWYERAYIRVYIIWGPRIFPVWRLGQLWHQRFHPTEELDSACDYCPICRENDNAG